MYAALYYPHAGITVLATETNQTEKCETEK